MTARERPYADPERAAMADLMWQDEFGDRHTSMAVLVCGAEPAEVHGALAAALLTDEEMAAPRSGRSTATLRRLARRPVRSRTQHTHRRASAWHGRRRIPDEARRPPRLPPGRVSGLEHRNRVPYPLDGDEFTHHRVGDRGRHPDLPLVVVEVSADSHPFWTGRQRVLDSAGQVEKFRRRYGTRG